jgi:hypothetical protein
MSSGASRHLKVSQRPSAFASSVGFHSSLRRDLAKGAACPGPGFGAGRTDLSVEGERTGTLALGTVHPTPYPETYRVAPMESTVHNRLVPMDSN